MAATNLEKQAAPTDTTVLGRYWMLNDDDTALERAAAEIDFELSERARRRSIHTQNAAASDRLQAEIHAEIEAIDTVFDVDQAGL